MKLEELKMTDKLTPKQEAFAMAYVECGNASNAYRMAYDVNENTSDNSISVEASKLRNNPKITLRILELQELAQERHSITVDSLTDELEKARKTAQEAGQASAMVAATMGKAKLHGLLTDKAQISSPEESMRPTTIVLVGEPVPDYEGLN
jgi:phage terminase small subunit